MPGNHYSIQSTAPGTTFTVGPADTLNLDGTINNQGTIYVYGGYGGAFPYNNDYDGTVLIANAILTGGGTLRLNQISASQGNRGDVTSKQATSSLDNFNNTITGSGLLTEDAGDGQSLSITNESGGTFNATDASFALEIDRDAVANAGLIESTNTGGLLLHALTLTQSGTGMLLASGAGSVVNLDGATVLGGTIATSGGGAIVAINSSNNVDILSGVLVSAGSQVRVLDNLHLRTTITNRGTITIAPLSTNANLFVDGAVTLTGGGSVVLSASGTANITSGQASTLDNIDNTISGAGTLTADIGDGGSLAITNEAAGVIGVMSAAARLTVGGDPISNKGLLEALSGGYLVLQNLALSQSAGGRLLANGAGSSVQLNNVTITGGVLSASNGGVVQTTGNATLAGTAAITAGTILVGAGTTLTAGPQALLGGALDIEGTLNTDASRMTTQSVGSLAGAGSVAVGTSGNTAVVASLSVGSDGTSTTFSGSLSSGTNVTLGLVKAGTGVLTLSGVNNRYAGGTTIQGGTLDVAASGAAGSGPITFASNAATLVLEAGALPPGGTFGSTIAGFVAGDVIQLTGSVTTATYVGNTGSAGGTLTLSNGASTVGKLLIQPGSPTQTSFRVTTSGGRSNITLSTPAQDFNGDGRSDVLVQGDNGTVAVGFTNGLSVSGIAPVASPGVAWHLIGSADFDGDGRADLVFQNTDGTLMTEVLNGTAVTAQGSLGNLGATWHARGIADFNGDGRADVLMQNTVDGALALVATAAGGTSAAAVVQLGTFGASWHVEGVGDFDGDGLQDALFQNDDGRVGVVLQSNLAAGVQVLGNPGPGAVVMGTGDYNGDGKTDALVRMADGSVVLGTISGAVVTGLATIGNPGAAYTAVVAGGDYNGDGKLDVLLQATDSTVAAATLDGSSNAVITAFAVLGQAGAGERVVGDVPTMFLDGTAAGTVAGTPGADAFLLNTPAAGTHRITGFDAALDRVVLSAAVFGSYGAVQAAEMPSASGTTINLGSGASLLLAGITPAQLHASNFVFA